MGTLSGQQSLMIHIRYTYGSLQSITYDWSVPFAGPVDLNWVAYTGSTAHGQKLCDGFSWQSANEHDIMIVITSSSVPVNTKYIE